MVKKKKEELSWKSRESDRSLRVHNLMLKRRRGLRGYRPVWQLTETCVCTWKLDVHFAPCQSPDSGSFLGSGRAEKIFHANSRAHLGLDLELTD